MSKREWAAAVKYAGAFIAWVIGSGFATGQEILQFFSSYGVWSFAVLAVALVGFALLGVMIVTDGYDHRKLQYFDQYEYYCGKGLGHFYGVAVPLMLVLIISVLLSAAGATLQQYYSVNRYIGSVIMAALILSLTRIIRTRFLRADFPPGCVKMLANTEVFAPLLPCRTKNPPRKNSAT